MKILLEFKKRLTRRKSTTVLVLGLVLVIIIAGAIAVLIRQRTIQISEGSGNGNDGVPTLLYAEKETETDETSRYWDTAKVRIFKDQPNADRELIGEVDGVGQAYVYTLSPDKKTLLINQPERLASLNLSTGDIRTLITSTPEIRKAIYSPEGNKLFIWEKNLADYSFTEFDILTNTSTVLKKETIAKKSESYLPLAWRSDNKILISAIQDNGQSGPWYFDLGSNELLPSPIKSSIAEFAPNGQWILTEKSNVRNICSSYDDARLTSTYSVYDPITGKEYGMIGKEGRAIDILGFSPNAQKVLFSNYKPAAIEVQCNMFMFSRDYYTSDISGSKTVPVGNYRDLLLEWGVEFDAFETKRTSDGMVQYLYNDKEVGITQNTGNIRIIAEYLSH